MRELLVGDVVVGDLGLVEGDAEPALVLRVGPGVDERDARRSQFVRGRPWEPRAAAYDGDPEAGGGALERLREVGGIAVRL